MVQLVRSVVQLVHGQEVESVGEKIHLVPADKT